MFGIIQHNGDVQRPSRLVWADVLRVFCIFSVVCVHCAAHKWKSSFDGTLNPEWIACVVQDSFWRGNVPVMLMLSGALILPRESACALKKLPVRIVSIMLPLVVWSMVYIYVRNHRLVVTDIFSILYKKQMYHLWFIYMMAGLYCIVPILKLIRDKMVVDLEFALLLVACCLLVCVVFYERVFPLLEKGIATLLLR